MSRVAKQNSVLKSVHKERSDKVKSITKSSSNGISKEDGGVAKRKIVKENGVHSIDGKKSEKDVPITNKTKPNAKGHNDNKLERTKIKVESTKVEKEKTKVEKTAVKETKSKSVIAKNGKPVQKQVSTDKSRQKPSASHPPASNSEPKRSKEKVNSTSIKESTQSKPIKNAVKMTEMSTKTKAAPSRPAPMKASHAIGAKSVATTKISPKNAMNLVHNVTVSSPPPMRREIVAIEEEDKPEIDEQATKPPRSRTRTRTLDNDEIILLKPKLDSVEPKSMPVTINGIEAATEKIVRDVEVKPPVSFEIMLDKEKNAAAKPINDRKSEPVPETKLSDDESADYDDDFESYESDFESDVSDANEDEDDDDDDEEEKDGDEQDESEEDEETSLSTGDSDTDENVVSTASRHPFETGHSIDNSEFDSGSFELKVLSARARDRNDAKPVAVIRRDHQIENDSGIENNSANALNAMHNGQMNSLDLNNKTLDNISDIENELTNSLDTNNSNRNKTNSGKVKTVKSSQLAKRGQEILSKITLDVMNYVLFDFKPIPYEVFMKIYGNSNTAQIAVQTHNDRIDQECQSDAIEMQTTWSQFPITYYTEHIGQPDFDDYKNGCGRVVDQQQSEAANENFNKTCENSLNLIQSMSIKSSETDDSMKETNISATININYENLNRFLLETEMTISRILYAHVPKRRRDLMEATLPMSTGLLKLNINIAGNVDSNQVQRIFATVSLPGFLFTLHRTANSDLNVIAMWNLMSLQSPVCLLSVWSKVVCLEVHPKIKDIVFAGLNDGSIAVWDYSESKYWHPNLESETIKRFVPSQVTTPAFDSKDINDFGECIAIRGLMMATDTELLNGYNPKQLCSLHECGLLILWTVLSNTTGTYVDLANKRIDHQSMWSKVKLIQNKVIDLGSSSRQMKQFKLARPTSKSFDKTRSYFESELFSDAALQELHEMDTDEEKVLTNFRCTAIELSAECILISTNENFILFGRKSFRNESFRRIQIDPNKSVRVECMLSLSNLDDDIVLIALNNGSVKSLCCDQNVEQIDELHTNSDIEESSSSVSSLTSTVDNKKVSLVNLPTEPFDFSMASPSIGPLQIATAAPLQAATGFFSDNTASNFGKSCTIQSLVQNERKIYDEQQAQNHLENIEYKSPQITIANKMPTQRSMRSGCLVSGQTIVSNSVDIFSTVSSQCLVQLTKSKQLIILRKNRLCAYDLLTCQSNDMPTNQINFGKYVEAIATTADHFEEFLILLNEGKVELHQFSTEPNNR